MFIPDEDSLFRPCIYPISFKGNKRVFSPEKLIKLYDSTDGFLASVAWERFVPSSQHVHGYGCRLAARINQKDLTIDKDKANTKNKIYCGAYQFSARAIRGLSVAEGLEEIESADVIHHIEEGEIAHTDLRVVLKTKDNCDVEGTKTAVLDRLWNLCYGPISHVCDCDCAQSPHPSEALISAPSGEYRDNRSRYVRSWHIIRFHILEWIHQNFHPWCEEIRAGDK